jgi:hypothetical protein
MHRGLFWIRDSGFAINNPVAYAFALDFDVYIDREYAPLEERIVAYTKYASQIPTALHTMQENLELPLPAPYAQTAHAIFTGMASYMENTVPGLFSAVEDEQLQRQFTAVNSVAARAVKQTATWLDEQRASATDDYALGEEKFLEMLRATQGVDISRRIRAGRKCQGLCAESTKPQAVRRRRCWCDTSIAGPARVSRR